ncbi:MAG: alpha-2-macroglobulin family protein [Acidobacteriota bacterium]
MKTISALAVVTILSVLLLAVPTPQVTPDFERARTEADRLYSEGSFSLARSAYQQALAVAERAADKRWISFRLADAQWRAQAGTQTADSTQYDQARQELENLIREIERPEDRDLVWAEAHQSLGDFWWARRETRSWSRAWTHYQQALDWWAGSPDLERARQRYLNIAWTIAKPGDADQYYYYGYYGNVLPLEVLENALKIAQSDEDRAHAHYLIAMTVRHQGGDWERRRRVPEEFEAALEAGKRTDWYDDALYHYAEWMANQGRVIDLEDGQWRQEPDYVKALELFRRLVREYAKGETRYYDQAEQQIKTITAPVVGVSVPNIFLPGSEIPYYLNWRNCQRVDLTLTRVNLTRDVRFSQKETHVGSWLQAVVLAPENRVKSWSRQVEDKNDHKPRQEALRLEEKLPLGAYILEARSGQAQARELVLVTDRSLVLKTAGRQTLAYFCDAVTGAPVPAAHISLWTGHYEDSRWIWRTQNQQTNRDGIAFFTVHHAEHHTQVFAGAILEGRQAFSFANDYRSSQDTQPWRIYAFTDRPAYRPRETVQWKLIARRLVDSVYSTPSQQTIEFEIRDPRGSKVEEGRAGLNSFGSAWGSVELSESMPLGEYTVSFWDDGRKTRIGQATLFRLDEYKLPEFKVSIRTPDQNGRTRTYQLGDKVEASVQADYYFGGAVANATVEVVVHQSPFYPSWQPPRDYPWFYADMSVNPRYWGGTETVIKREQLKTDAAGKALVVFETPRHSQQDFQYRIEARVTDRSRREIVASQTLRVTRQPYFIYPRPQHSLYRPQDKVTVDIKALDANQQPVQVEGRVKVTRDFWYEIWVDSTGRELQGDELKALQRNTSVFPPPVSPGSKPWQLKFRGYQQDEILTRLVKTGDEGEATFSFTPEREGFYRVAWTSSGRGKAPVQASTAVWVARNATTDLGYRPGGLEIILDNDTFQIGKTAPVLVSVPTQDRYVLFTAEAEDFLSYQLVHVTGTVKMVEMKIGDQHVPNFFLAGAMVSDRQFFQERRQVVVPPVRNFLKVELKSDRFQYQPREEGTLTITTTDDKGEPVAAEVALGVADAAVTYIQEDYAGDPRQFFFSRKRQASVQTQSTLNVKSYAMLLENAQKQLVDAHDFDGRLRFDVTTAGGGTGGKDEFRGGVVAGRVAGLSENFPAAMAPEEKEIYSKTEGLRNEREPDKAVVDRASQAQAVPGQEPAVQVRSDFRSTMFWQPDVVTGSDGKAVVKVNYPDSLTTWKATARVAAAGSQFGMGSTETQTQQPLIVRLQAPRFFLSGDEVTVSAVINNNTGQAMTVIPALQAEGVVIQTAPQRGSVTVPAHGEARSDWQVQVKSPGSAKLRVAARSDRHADAMEREFPVYEHGLEKFISKAGKMQGDSVTIRLELPRDRKAHSTRLRVQVAPSLAVSMLDALPYLVDYPYGCTEQTMSRFLPAAITFKTLKELGLSPQAAMNRVFGGIVEEHAGQTHPKGRKDLNQLEEMIRQGLDRLYSFQHSDGGWGWWKEGDSDHFMSAYVVWGLTLARQAGIPVRPESLSRGVAYLDQEIVEEESNPDQQAWMLHALSVDHFAARRQGTAFQSKAFDNLWSQRQRLNAYTRALLALAAHHYGNRERAQTLVQNLENGVKRDSRPDTSILIKGEPVANGVLGTAHWGEDGISWRWSDGGVEATSFALRALLAIDPQNRLVEPATNWLIRNRRGAQWSNTRDTAIAILALNDYLKQSGELSSALEYELRVNHQLVAVKEITASEVLAAPSQFQVDPKLIRDGLNEIQIIRRKGQGPIYFTAQAQFFSQEEPIAAAGNEIFVRRQYYRLASRPTLLKGFVTERQLLHDGQTIQSGERVEVVLIVEAKNNYEYLVFEDLKPAGLEAVQLRSGASLFTREIKTGSSQKVLSAVEPSARLGESDYTNRSRWVYQELRDRKVALFLDKLPEGLWEIRYELRAEVPGRFHALPVVGHAMYLPEIRCNGEEQRINVSDR